MYKKARERIGLSPLRVEQGGSKDSHPCKIIMYKTGKVDTVWRPTQPKIRIASKKALNQSCAELNFELKRLIRIFGSIEHPTESTLPLLYIIILLRWESFEPLAPLQGGDRHMRSGTFCTKFNFEHLLYKAIFDAMRILGSVVPQTVSTSPFLYIIIFPERRIF